VELPLATTEVETRGSLPDPSVIDFGAVRELGGLTIDWNGTPPAFTVELSRDGEHFDTVHAAPRNGRSRSLVWLPDADARAIRIRGGAIREVRVQPPGWAETANDLYALVAKSEPPGHYPRYLAGQQSYWTVIGAAGSDAEALVGEDGALEPFKGGFSIEPFVRAGDELMTWKEVTPVQTLAEEDLPIPSVTWRAQGLSMVMTAAVTPDSRMVARYRLRREPGASPASPLDVTLFLTIRPFQVNPSTQFLNLVGGVSPIRSLSFDAEGVTVNGSQRVDTVTKPSRAGATMFDQGEVVDYLGKGEPGADSVAQTFSDPNGTLTGALMYSLKLRSGEERDIYIAVPIEKGSAAEWQPADAERALQDSAGFWREKLHRVAFDIPAAPEIGNTIRTNIAYMLIDRDGPAFKPGARSYDRSWIRDGALIASTLLRLGHAEEAKGFASWFAKYQFESGKVPCCVDSRGADPVPENDSHGELIYLIAEIYRYTHDATLVRQLWPNVEAAARYIDRLRSENLGAFKGLVTESISHEGYSAKPMHSYWDDFFCLKGLEEAAMLAGVLGLSDRRRELERQATDFAADLGASIRRSIDEHHIDYVPGSAELGDFDATSTAIGISPLNLGWILPAKELQRTFARYLESLDKPRSDYTPYETRIIGALVRLGDRTHVEQLIDRFLRDRRPEAWNEWAEVVASDPRGPIFIGDMPHVWVASDFIRSMLDAIAFDRDDGTLVIGAGVPSRWVSSKPLHVGPLATASGTIDVQMKRAGNRVEIDLGGTARPRHLIVQSPDERPIRSARINGKRAGHGGHEIIVLRLPARVVFSY